MRFAPEPRLLWITALGLVPALTAAVAVPELALYGLGWIGLWTLVLAIDAARVPRQLTPLRAKAVHPQNLNKDRPGTWTLHLSGVQNLGDALTLGVAWPQTLAGSPESLHIRVPPDTDHVRLDWPCTARSRGVFRWDAIHAQLLSPWGFWVGRIRVPVPGEIRVHPDLWRDRRQIAALFLPRGLAGWRVRRQAGQGREFEKLRDYLPGDALQDIHWKASAKRGRPVTKEYQVERTQEVYVVVDVSRLSGRLMARPTPTHSSAELTLQPGIDTTATPTSTPARTPGHPLGDPQAESDAESDAEAASHAEPQLEAMLTSALLLGWAAQRQGDLFGLIAFGAAPRLFLRAARGRDHFLRCRESLHSLSVEDGSPDFAELFASLRLRLRRRALIILLTALDDPLLAEEFERAVRSITRQHLVLVNQIAPTDACPLFTRPPPPHLDDALRQLVGHHRWHTLRAVSANLARVGAHFHLLPAPSLTAELVSQYLDVKRHQWL
jgi:uncharacterized protein (DUF58 family)